MPELVRLYIRQVAIGFGIAAVFVALLLGLNVANLRHLVFASSDGLLALFLLFFFNGIVFAGVQFGIAVMRMAEPENGGGGKSLPQAAHDAWQALTVPVKVSDDDAWGDPRRK
ncbi:hypothetical protein C2I36_10215 [Rhodobacteraceae bacterium WD3A24]|nr:hypothetical protein C2I36_10215 [Rhodobacteraceae bacterium WD3A24]